MSNIRIGQVWKNRLGAELTIISTGHQRMRVLSDDIWIAERRDTIWDQPQYAVTEHSLADCEYTLYIDSSEEED